MNQHSGKVIRFISLSYLSAGFFNVFGVLIFSLCFSNQYLSNLYPEVFSNFGMLMIILWGFAYIAVFRHWFHFRALAAVFALEKLIYVISWIYWIAHFHEKLPDIIKHSPLTGVFYLTYGLNDFVFFVVFLVAYRVSKNVLETQKISSSSTTDRFEKS